MHTGKRVSKPCKYQKLHLQDRKNDWGGRKGVPKDERGYVYRCRVSKEFTGNLNFTWMKKRKLGVVAGKSYFICSMMEAREQTNCREEEEDTTLHVGESYSMNQSFSCRKRDIGNIIETLLSPCCMMHNVSWLLTLNAVSQCSYD